MLRVEQRRNSFFQRWLLCFAEIPLAKSPPPLPPGILPVNEKNTSDYKSLPDTPPPSSNYKFPSESEFKLSICGERNEMWENAFFFAFCSRVTSRDSPKWKACRTKKSLRSCVETGSSLLSSRFRFRRQVGTRESIGQKGTKSGSGTLFNLKEATGWVSIPPKALRCGATELATPLTTFFNSCIRSYQGKPLALRLEKRRVGVSFQERWLPRQGELSTSSKKQERWTPRQGELSTSNMKQERWLLDNWIIDQ